MTLIDKAEALSPCPFCGGVAEQDYQQPYRSLSAGKLGKACTIYCTECGANVILCHEDHPGVSPDDLMAELVAAWNRRAIPARGVGEYTLAPHLQKIVDGAKTTPQWDMQADRLAPTDAAQAREAALELAVTVVRQALVDAAFNYKHDKALSSAMFKAETHATNAILALIGEARK